ncbi:MAG TPA: MBL fold metallo-hydrolase [Allosphingosinicella sp.]|jgi:competence protein ComEC|nr:MBL fold metallo-hydrolase [Allosphingosinicella sp.]
MNILTRAFLSLVAVAAAPAAAFAQPVATPAAPAAAGPQPAAGEYVVHAIDVGTGLAIFVEGSDFTLLYDAGSNDDDARGANNRVVAYLRAVRPDLRAIDHVVLSHPHKDHSELMPDVIEQFAVANLWDSGAVNPICSYRNLLTAAAARGVAYHNGIATGGMHSNAFEAQRCYGRPVPAGTVEVPRADKAQRGRTILLGDRASLTFLHADGSRQSSFNANSMVARLTLGTRVLLLPGDAEAGPRVAPSTPPTERSVEGQLLRCCGALLRADILVAGHHGSTTSSRAAFLDAVGAMHYIVSSGPTRYGTVTLPDAPVIGEFTRRGTVWRTDVDDAACAANPAKIGRDADGKPGGCDNIRIAIASDGMVRLEYSRRAD